MENKKLKTAFNYARDNPTEALQILTMVGSLALSIAIAFNNEIPGHSDIDLCKNAAVGIPCSSTPYAIAAVRG